MRVGLALLGHSRSEKDYLVLLLLDAILFYVMYRASHRYFIGLFPMLCVFEGYWMAGQSFAVEGLAVGADEAIPAIHASSVLSSFFAEPEPVIGYGERGQTSF